MPSTRVRRCESFSLSRLWRLSCALRAPPFYISRGRVHGCWIPDRWAQRCDKITRCSYLMALQAREISLLDSLACSRSPPSIMSWRCLVKTEPDAASSIACYVAERLCRERRKRHDGKVPGRRIHLMRQTGSARRGSGGSTVLLGNTRRVAGPVKRLSCVPRWQSTPCPSH